MIQIIIFIAFAWYLRKHKDKLTGIGPKSNTRASRMKEAAKSLYCEFQIKDKQEPLLLGMGGKQLNIFQGHLNSSFSNIMSRQTRDGETKVTLCDYSYDVKETGSQKIQSCQVSLAIIENAALKSIPSFYVHPVNAFYHLIGKAQEESIECDGFIAFSKMYLLYGQDKPAIQQLFETSLCALLQEKEYAYLQLDSDRMYFFKLNALSSPEQMRDFLNESFQLYNAMLDTASPA